MTDKKPTILCVDDEPKNLELLEALLAPRGYDVAMAASGGEALAKAASGPDLILLDIMMPGVSGYDVLKRLRADEKTRLIPVVMVTALRETEDRVTALEAGCDDFISKPFEKIELLARVKSLLKLSYYRRQLDEKEKFEAAVRGMSDGVLICSRDWSLEEANAAARRYLNLGGAPGEDLREHIFRTFTATIPREMLSAFGGRLTFDLVRPEGDEARELILEAEADRILGADGDCQHIVVTVKDVTGRRREMRTQWDFLALISHKLRTPLTVLINNGDMLSKGSLGEISDKQRNALDAMMRGLHQLDDLFDHLIRYISISGSVGLAPEPVRLPDVAGILAGKYAPQVTEGKMRLEFDVPATLPPVPVAKEQLEYILTELADNAIKFNDKTALALAIRAKVGPGDVVTISVADNGAGIPSEAFERIFDLFYQEEKYFTGQVKGAGLGLTLVRKLVEKAGGTIAVESALGRGTTFTLIFPSRAKTA
jgi:signal transduction histidine kinase